MAAWRNKQPKDYELPSDLDKLGEIRRRHLQSNGQPAGERDRKKPREEAGRVKAPRFRYLVVLVIVILALSGMSGFIVYEQQKGFDRRAGALTERITALERDMARLQKYIGDAFRGLKSDSEEVLQRTDGIGKRLDKLQRPPPVPRPAPVPAAEEATGEEEAPLRVAP